jgi:hypothetical protein
MTAMACRIGFDRKIELAWMDALTDELRAGRSEDELRDFLHDLLRSDHPADTARGKTITVLMRIWALVPPEHRSLRRRALELQENVPRGDFVWLHWGMLLMGFPIFRDIASGMGRLLSLQGDVSLAQLQRRLTEEYGERSTVSRASQRIVRSMVEWGAITEAEKRGTFVPAEKYTTASADLQLWLVEALLTAKDAETVEATQLLKSHELFPFSIDIGIRDLRRSDHFVVHRQGQSMDVVEVREQDEEGEEVLTLPLS